MTPQEIAILIQNVGISVVIIIAIAWFFTVKIWPLIIDRIKKSDEELERLRQERRAERSEWIAALSTHDEKITKAFVDLGDTLKRAFEERDSKLEQAIAKRDEKLFDSFRKVISEISPRGK